MASPVAPPTVEPVIEPIIEPIQERQPDLAEFMASYPQEAYVEADVRQLTEGPRFGEITPTWEGSIAGNCIEFQSAASANPKSAIFQTEFVDARVFDAGIRLQSAFSAPSDTRNRLLESLPPYDISVTISGHPGGAMFLADQPAGRMESRALQSPSEPIFSAKSIARTWSAAAGVGATQDRRLRSEQFFSGTEALSVTEGTLRGSFSEPRWKSLEQVLPGQSVAKIILVLESFLRRPVRVALGQSTLPESFEIKLLPIPFPPFSPRMASLEERLHRTDRIGFSPP